MHGNTKIKFITVFTTALLSQNNGRTEVEHEIQSQEAASHPRYEPNTSATKV